jgi:predicted ATPase/class 3 adenylate cyclase
MSDLPTGIVTFLFTDIEGSTKLLRRLGDSYRDVISQHHRILREAIAHGEGVEVGTEGDAFFAVFLSPAGALATAVQAQRGLAAAQWPGEQDVRVRMGLHTGQAVLVGEDYMGLDIHLAARIAAAAHGGQILLSETVRHLVADAVPNGVSVRDLGRHRLKDIERPVHLWDLIIDGLPEEFPAIRSLDARPTNLPLQRTSFIGREREVAEVTTLLAESRLVTLTGPGGTGKTRLALKVAADHLDRFSDGVFFVDLSPIVDAALVPSAIAHALIVREEPGRELLETLADHARDRNLLLVIDNSEQVIESGLTVATLLDAAPRLSVLATSRVPFRISGERAYAVPPLAVPADVAELNALGRSEAVALFTERAAAVRPGFRLTPENAAAMAEITRRLDGLPLAIELAASRLNVLTPQGLVERLGQRLALLSGGARDIPERQRTLRRTIEWSHELLGSEDQRLFARLAVFSGGWTLSAADIVCGPGLEVDVVDGLGALMDNSLVRPGEPGDADPRFGMLETIREFAVERLAVSEEEDALRLRHAIHYRSLAEEAEPHLTREDRLDWFTRLDAEHDNLRAVLDWAERSEDAATGLRVAASVWRFWLQRGHLAEGRARVERLLSLPGADARDPVRAHALSALGGITYWQNDYPPMRAAYQEAVDIAREVGDPGLLASALRDLSFVPYIDQDPDRVEAILREGLAAAQEAGDRLLTAEFWSSVGFLEMVRGNPTAAIEVRRTALEIYREEGAIWNLGEELGGLAMIHRMIGDLQSARACLRESLEITTRAKDTLGISLNLTSLALLANDEGRHDRAARLMGAVARVRDELGGGIPRELIGRWGDPEEDARQALGDDEYQRALVEGYAMDTEAAVTYALEERA